MQCSSCRELRFPFHPFCFCFCFQFASIETCLEYSPGDFAESGGFSVAAALGRRPAPSTRRCCAAQRLRGPSTRPIAAGVGNLPRHTENVGRQGLRQASGSIYLQAARRGECWNKSGHGSGRKRGAFVWPHAQQVEENVHHEASYADATIAGPR